jgi:hypothetical protein
LELQRVDKENPDTAIFLEKVRSSGAVIKWLDNITVIAIYRTSNSANTAFAELNAYLINKKNAPALYHWKMSADIKNSKTTSGQKSEENLSMQHTS